MRYIVQEHWARAHHFDLRLEHNGTYLSWAIPKEPSFNPADKRLAIQTPDHSHECATFEGEIPKGNYGAGKVQIWDQGTWTPTKPVEEMVANGRFTFKLEGGKLAATWCLIQTKAKNWLFFRKKDKIEK